MVTSTVTFSAPCLRARSHPFLISFCTSSHFTPGFRWMVVAWTMAIVGLPNVWWFFCGPDHAWAIAIVHGLLRFVASRQLLHLWVSPGAAGSTQGTGRSRGAPGATRST